MAGKPDREAARAKYAHLAPTYDRQLWWLRDFQEPLRRSAVELLQLQAGQVVVDVGCGTGASFRLLEEAVGPSGHIIGIEQSGQMLQFARERIEVARWRNVTLLEMSADDPRDLGRLADAALFFFTHDILRTPAAVEATLSRLKSGGRVVAAGMKRTSSWCGTPLNLAALAVARRYVTTLEGLERPWSHLESHLSRLQVEPSGFGLLYVAFGKKDLADDRRASERRS